MRIFRRGFLKLGAAGAGAGLLGAKPASPASVANLTSSTVARSKAREEVFSVSIREYLIKQARGITKRAISDYQNPATFRRLLPERRRQFLEMMGLENFPPYGHRPPLNVQVTGVVERGAYRIEKLYYESLPKLYVTANLYVPKPLTARAPGVLYVCGHVEKQKVYYQAHARRFAELGFVCLLMETLEGGEVRGYHHGPYYEGRFHWYSRGYTPAGVEMLNGIRALDLLAQRPEVSEQLGVTGISGGGAYSWFIPAGDERVKVAAPTCGTATLRSHIYDLSIDDHCDCMWWVNNYRWDLAGVGALIAPRPLMIASADHDSLFTITSIREVHEQLAILYRKLGAPENLRLVITPGGHGYHPRSRAAIFSWFLAHLQGKEVPPEEVGDIDSAPERQESGETLRVFVNGSPPGNRTTTIQDDFFRPPEATQIRGRSELEEARERVAAALRKQTFGAFPAAPPPLGTQVEFVFEEDGSVSGGRFAFTSEEGWRLHGQWSVASSVRPPAPAVVGLRCRGERRNNADAGRIEKLLGQIQAPWIKVVVEPRGTGETAWGEELQWHLRRATAWIGTTLASLWVFDTLRALQTVRSLDEVKGSPVALAARGEMAAVALYAALVDGQVSTLFLETPPATQNAPSQPDGRGPAVEMLSCLRITDLPQVAGLLFPTELVFVGECSSTYDWAESLYARLGSPGRFRRVKELKEWRATE